MEEKKDKCNIQSYMIFKFINKKVLNIKHKQLRSGCQTDRLTELKANNG